MAHCTRRRPHHQNIFRRLDAAPARDEKGHTRCEALLLQADEEAIAAKKREKEREKAIAAEKLKVDEVRANAAAEALLAELAAEEQASPAPRRKGKKKG